MSKSLEREQYSTENTRTELLHKLVIPQVLSTITPDNESAIPPFDVSIFETINIEQQAEISQVVMAQWEGLLHAIPSELTVDKGKKLQYLRPKYGLKKSFWKEHKQKYKEHLPEGKLSSTIISTSYPFPDVMLFKGHAYYRGMLMGDMVVRFHHKSPHVLFYNHLFYGDKFALEIKQKVESGALFDRQEIVYPNIPTPAHLDFDFESRIKRTHYKGDVDEISGPFTEIDSLIFEDMPSMFVSFDRALVEGDIHIKEHVEHIDFPRRKTIEISKPKYSDHTRWYVNVGYNHVEWLKSYKISETDNHLIKIVENYEFSGRVDPKGNFWIAPEFFIEQDEQSAFYKGKSMSTLI